MNSLRWVTLKYFKDTFTVRKFTSPRNQPAHKWRRQRFLTGEALDFWGHNFVL